MAPSSPRADEAEDELTELLEPTRKPPPRRKTSLAMSSASGKTTSASSSIDGGSTAGGQLSGRVLVVDVEGLPRKETAQASDATAWAASRGVKGAAHPDLNMDSKDNGDGSNGGNGFIGLTRQLLMPLLIPSLCFFGANALMAPQVPVFTRWLGYGDAAVGVAQTAGSAGRVAAALPFGQLYASGGSSAASAGSNFRAASLIAATLAASSSLLLFAAACNTGDNESDISASSRPSPRNLQHWLRLAPVATALFATGAAQTFFTLSRAEHVRGAVPRSCRARALALMGGSRRAGYLVMPVLGGLLTESTNFRTAFALQGIFTLVCVPCVFSHRPRISPPEEEGIDSMNVGNLNKARSSDTDLAAPQTKQQQRPRLLLRETLAAHWGRLLRAGLVSTLFVLVRVAIQLLLPLQVDNLGLDRASLGAITSLSFVVDCAVFVFTGSAMDRFGRKCLGVPAFGVWAVGIASIGWAKDELHLYLSSALLGLANGLTGPMVALLGTDFAPPPPHAVPFLSIFRFLSDLGSMVAPPLVGVLSESISLSFSAYTIAGMALFGGVWMGVVMEEPHPLRGAKSPIR